MEMKRQQKGANVKGWHCDGVGDVHAMTRDPGHMVPNFDQASTRKVQWDVLYPSLNGRKHLVEHELRPLPYLLPLCASGLMCGA